MYPSRECFILIISSFAPMVAFSIGGGNKSLYHHKQIQETSQSFHASKSFLRRNLILSQHPNTSVQHINKDTLDDETKQTDPIQRNPINDKEIVITSTIELPFSAHTAFDAFSDLSRQPSWSHWLKSVQYIQGDNDKTLPTTKWTLGVKGFTFSWIARSTKLVRPHLIEWESISGLKNRGMVRFVELNQSSKTEMSLTLIFITPRILSKLFNNSGGRIKSAIESSMIQSTLMNFRDVVIRHDLKG